MPLTHVVVFWIEPERRFDGRHGNGWINPLEVCRFRQKPGFYFHDSEKAKQDFL